MTTGALRMAAALVRLGATWTCGIETTGDTPLIRAARMGNVELVKVFLAAKADVHSTTRDGATALTEAIRGGHEEVVGLLRAAGADAAATPVERPVR